MTRTLVYSQDSGGAAVVARVASRLEAVPSLPPRVTAVHPLSEALFRRLGVTATPVSKWLDTLPASDRAIDRWLDDIQVSHLICSLSSTRLDLTNARLIARARARGVRTLGYLDHWVGFERLTTLNGEQDYLPDLIGCIDSYLPAFKASSLKGRCAEVHSREGDLADQDAAFQRRWRPEQIDGVIDGEIRAILFQLLLDRDRGLAR